MHEFSLASSMLDVTLESAAAHDAARITRVVCRVGAMRQVVPALMHTAFEACCAGTIAENAELVLEIEPVQVTCCACGHAASSETVVYDCPKCGSVDVVLEGGQEITLMSISLEQENGHGDCGPAQRAGTQRCHGG
jgi:hydrogenase nickel incorporation protein HypA/HybF